MKRKYLTALKKMEEWHDDEQNKFEDHWVFLTNNARELNLKIYLREKNNFNLNYLLENYPDFCFSVADKEIWTKRELTNEILIKGVKKSVGIDIPRSFCFYINLCLNIFYDKKAEQLEFNF